jgi:malate synthase
MGDKQDRNGQGPEGISISGTLGADHREILTDEALAFVADLTRTFAPSIEQLLERRVQRRKAWRDGQRLDFLPDTREIRESAWRVASVPTDLQQRIVEITGPVDRKMVINALNSGADTFMGHADPVSGKRYQLNAEVATLLVRPRGLHLHERNCTVDGRAVPGSLFDFGLYLFHNARALIDRGSGPYFYLAKLESHLEARLWNDVFLHAQQALGLPRGTIKATVLIETLPAAFEMDEILHELREHSSGLNCGRWDYIFSFIKCHRWTAADVLPDRSQVTMEQPFMRAYTQLAVRTCHRRGAHAIGGMAAQIPIKTDPEANRIALDKVRADKLREVRDGHDGTWVAHPGLVSIARETFEGEMQGPNQLDRLREDVEVSAEDLLRLPTGTRTEQGLRHNIRVGVQYLEAWLRGTGCVPIYHLMEDAATAEISRAQVWQWLRHGASLDDGRPVTGELVRQVVGEEMDVIRDEVGTTRFEQGRFGDARDLFTGLCFSDEMEEFLTSYAYDKLEGPTGTS